MVFHCAEVYNVARHGTAREGIFTERFIYAEEMETSGTRAGGGGSPVNARP